MGLGITLGHKCPLPMQVGTRLKALREEKNLTQDDIEKASGLSRSYLSRVENGHTVPTLDTLEKWAKALDMALYQIMYDGDEPPKPPKPPVTVIDQSLWGYSRKQASELIKLQSYLAKMDPKHREALLAFVTSLARERAGS